MPELDTPPENPGTGEEEALRAQSYNATLVKLVPCNEYLRILRVRGDHSAHAFHPGQYTALGLGYWEPRVAGAPTESIPEAQHRRLCRRAYSISHPVLDDATGELVPGPLDFSEFYITLIDQANQPNLAPGLTPRLWMLKEGSRLFMGEKPTGHYSLATVRPDDDVIFAATGTGEAPHNAMISELLRRGHAGKIVSVVGARYAADLGYRAKHLALTARFPSYRYFGLTTREPENIGKKVYVQTFVEQGTLEKETGVTLDPARTHVFLCGNPAMIGLPKVVDGVRTFPKPRGLVEVLEARGFTADNRREHKAGNIHFEEYW